MSLECGIVGLPNVGKSTLFNALTSAENAAAENFPFCTIDPNVGVVELPDSRLQELAKIVNPKKIIPTSVTFVDIAGLVKGASKGEGLGNQFLGNIKNCDAIAHVVRCFEDPNVIHVSGDIDPIRDVEIIETELMLADLATVDKAFDRNAKLARSGDKDSKARIVVLEKLKSALEDGKMGATLELTKEEKLLVYDLHLITTKPLMYVANLSEEYASGKDLSSNPLYVKLLEHAKSRGSEVVPICAKIEAELIQLSGEEKAEFLSDLGIEEPGLNKLLTIGYKILGLQTYFTAGVQEVRAWTIHEGWKAPKAASVIHNDFERGFICAETIAYEDFVRCGGEAKAKVAGLMRTEGKEYVVKDGDVLHFRFNV
ncbi:redox-regulated ATPase YchF [bacterium]|nr:redox-regulated ATPase YchF [bacterium]